MNLTLAEFGMDSIMGSEIKQTLELSFDLVLSVGEIRNLTMGKLLELQGGAKIAEAAVQRDTSSAFLKSEVRTTPSNRNCMFVFSFSVFVYVFIECGCGKWKAEDYWNYE